MIDGRMITELSGKKVSPLGVGTWGIGGWIFPDKKNDAREIASLRFALDNGINVIDTAEIYGRGHAEEIVAEAITGRDRESLHITSKVFPTHLNRNGINKAVQNSLMRLKMKYIDLYLIHWPNPVANMREVMSTMEDLVDKGLIRTFGVSNFSVEDMSNAMSYLKKYKIEANQIEYSIMKKDADVDVVPFCVRNRIKIIAYTPLAKGEVATFKPVVEISKKIGKTPIQVALNYLMKNSLPIPKAGRAEHMKEILGSVGWELSDDDYKALRSA